MKNINSIAAIVRAIEGEASRQIDYQMSGAKPPPLGGNTFSSNFLESVI